MACICTPLKPVLCLLRARVEAIVMQISVRVAEDVCSVAVDFKGREQRNAMSLYYVGNGFTFAAEKMLGKVKLCNLQY